MSPGSPPRMRGKPQTDRYVFRRQGITPAGAGKTSPQFAPQGRTQGSPPQVRGKLLAVRLSPVLFRITPAGAGKTLKYILLCPKWWDHPRRCGENKDPELLLMYILGSPPQVRGKHGTMDAKTLDRGITPAGAGKTHLLDQFHFYLRDHPRRCGENLSAFTRKNRSGGSPPQVRGKRVIPRIRWMYIRITPAGAGKTLRQLKVCGHAWDHPRRCGENFFAIA